MQRLRELGWIEGRTIAIESLGGRARRTLREVEAATRTLELEAVTTEIQRPQNIAPGLEALKGRADALYVCGDPLVVDHCVLSVQRH